MLFSIAAALFSIPTNVSISHHKGFSFSTSLPTFVVFYFFFFLTLYFILNCSRLTMLWWFQVDSKGTQPNRHMSPFSVS